MVENMTDEDIEKLAEAIAKKTQDDHGFYVDPRQHYNFHELLDRILDAYDAASNIILKAIIGLFIAGVVAAIVFGAGLHK